MITISYIGAGLMGLGLGFLIGLTVACVTFSRWMQKSGLQLFPDGEIVSNTELVDLIEKQEAWLVTLMDTVEEDNNGHRPA
jgi:hypothetical protein